MQAHLHVDQHAKVLGDLARVHELVQELDGDERVVLHQVRQALGREAAVVDQLGVLLQLHQHLLLLRGHQRAPQRARDRLPAPDPPTQTPVNGHMVRSFPTHGQVSAAQSSTTCLSLKSD